MHIRINEDIKKKEIRFSNSQMIKQFMLIKIRPNILQMKLIDKGHIEYPLIVYLPT